MDKTSLFESHRDLLFAIAYRMLGSVMEAEDMVQESYLRWLGSDSDAVRSPKALLTTIVTRLCLDQLKSARHQRESYTGPWLPEPLLTADAPSVIVDRAETISLAFLSLLEQLTPVERGVFVLREVFDVDYATIAQVVDRSEVNCRQLFSRAKRKLRQDGRPGNCSSAAQARLLDSFMAALDTGDLDTLTTVLAEDVQLWSDGGGKVAAATRPLAGRNRVLAFFQGLNTQRPDDMRLVRAEVNRAPAWLIFAGHDLQVVFDFLVIDQRIVEIRAVRNPDKLRHLTGQV
ncbi:MAG: RNA polymerase sigma-70 factor [Caldilineaceae bacterium]|nr:RNA polymerase sigma-70 factor [Caldilineaceae bacterium]